MKNLIFIAFGGALGSLCRYFFNYFALFGKFPWWTLLENSLGSFLLGLLTGYILIQQIPKQWKNGLGVGFCGSFTTMSTFALDNYYLAHSFSLNYAGLYLSASLISGFTLALLGIYLGKKIALVHQERCRV